MELESRSQVPPVVADFARRLLRRLPHDPPPAPSSRERAVLYCALAAECLGWEVETVVRGIEPHRDTSRVLKERTVKKCDVAALTFGIAPEIPRAQHPGGCTVNHW